MIFLQDTEILMFIALHNNYICKNLILSIDFLVKDKFICYLNILLTFLVFNLLQKYPPLLRSGYFYILFIIFLDNKIYCPLNSCLYYFLSLVISYICIYLILNFLFLVPATLLILTQLFLYYSSLSCYIYFGLKVISSFAL